MTFQGVPRISFRAIFHQSKLIITIALHYWGDRIPAWCMYFISLFNYNYCFLTRVSMEVRRIRMMLTKVYADFSVSSVLFVNIPFFFFVFLRNFYMEESWPDWVLLLYPVWIPLPLFWTWPISWQFRSGRDANSLFGWVFKTVWLYRPF